MAAQVQGPRPMPNFTANELQAAVKKNPYVDDLGKSSLPQKKRPILMPPQDPVRLSPFFERLIDDIVHKVAIMVFFHIVHFFCHTFWEDYRQEFDRKELIQIKREAALDQKKETFESLKEGKSDLDMKLQKFLEATNHPKLVTKSAKTID